MLLRLWSSAKPECYNVKGLKRVLAAEGLHHMWLWISLMTQRQPHSVVSKKVQQIKHLEQAEHDEVAEQLQQIKHLEQAEHDEVA